MKTVIVFEDSSRVNFGGGQKITLMVCNILKEKYNLRFVDFSDSSRYSQIVKDQYGDKNFVNIGHGTIIGLNGLWTWIKMSFFLLLYIVMTSKKILYNLQVSDCISYTTGKRSLIIAAFLKWRYGIPFVHHAHLVENTDAYYFKIAKKLFKEAKAVLCVSKTVQNSIKTANCKLLYNPSLNSRGYKGEKKDKAFVVAFVGSLIHIKGVETFIDAAKLCPNNIEFRIYGEGPLRKGLEEQSRGRVRFMGFEQNIINRYYEDVDIVVIPTIIQEALPLVVVEAKSVGLPCIVTAPGGQAEIIRHGIDGFHVPMKNAQAIAEAVITLASNLEEYNNLSVKSYESFKLFSYPNFRSLIDDTFSINS